MEPEARYTLVGAVVLALVAAACVAWIWLSQGGGTASFRFYTIHFEKQSLEGLQQGSDVTMRGVKVGRVQEYSISRDNINRVDVIIRTDL
ncbi:MAG: MCE family protein [Burkholderiales bacterium]|nr:MCE family protein [Burkholderiales bacterium]